MADKIINVQDAFLNYMRKNRVPVTIFLLNGVKLSGVIACFDQNAIVMKREGYTQLVYKHAISTFSPHGAVSVFDWNGPQNSRANAQPAPLEAPQENYDEDSDEDDEYEEIIEF